MRKMLSSYPKLVREWHPTKNDDAKPENFTYGSRKKVWLLCPKGHEYPAAIGERTRKDPTGCPECYKNR